MGVGIKILSEARAENFEWVLVWTIFRANLAAQFVSARSESRLPNDMLSLHSGMILPLYWTRSN